MTCPLILPGHTSVLAEPWSKQGHSCCVQSPGPGHPLSRCHFSGCPISRQHLLSASSCPGPTAAVCTISELPWDICVPCRTACSPERAPSVVVLQVRTSSGPPQNQPECQKACGRRSGRQEQSQDGGPGTEGHWGRKPRVPSNGQNWENKDLAPG